MQFICIEIPGRISTVDGSKRVYGLLGGDAAIFDVITNLKINKYDKCVTGDNNEIKLPVPLILPLSQNDNSVILTASFRSSVSLVVEERRRKSGKVNYEVLGPICDNFTFDKLADFAFLNPVPVVHGKLATPKIIDPNYSDILFITADKYVKPPLFVKPPHTINNILSYRSTNKSNKERLDDAANDDFICDKGMNPVAKYSLQNVPNSPLSAAMKLDPDTELLQIVLALFDRRPIWIRQAIQEFIPVKYSNWKKKMAFSRACYLFSDGPWRGALVKLGYDPRTNSDSSIYQTIDFRDPYYRTIKYKTELNRSKKEITERHPNDETMKRIYGKFACDVIVPNLELHFLLPPNRPSQLYQLCDISDAKVQLLMTTKSNYSSKCSRASGWFHPSVLVQVRQIMNVKSKLMRQTDNR